MNGGLNNMENFNIVQIITTVLAWGVIGYIASRMYKKQLEKPKVWKIILIIMAGIFSFSINWSLFNTVIQISILPLGVWILYAFLNGKRDRWKTYRSFAWLGFFANYLLLVSTLMAIPVYFLLYPHNDPATYISNVEDASIINTHPSAKEQSLIKNNLQKQIHSLKEAEIYNDEWYKETYMNTDIHKRNERFPYILTNISPKWGSGIKTMVYIEDDGKGLLIITANKEKYFRSDHSLFEEVK